MNDELNVRIIFANRLRYLRKKYRMSQKELSAFTGVSVRHIRMWEYAKREADYIQLLRLAMVFSVSIDFLLGDTECERRYW